MMLLPTFEEFGEEHAGSGAVCFVFLTKVKIQTQWRRGRNEGLLKGAEMTPYRLFESPSTTLCEPPILPKV